MNLPLVIFDIDGTLSDNSHRQHLITEGKMLWGEFFSKMGEDLPVIQLVQLCKVLVDSKQYSVHLFTGRPERYRTLTEQWLTWNEIPPLPISMRKDGDSRPDYEVKQDMLNGLISRGNTVAFVIDDRRSVVEMWRANNILCLQCADHNY